MRRLLMRVVNRVLLSGTFVPAMAAEADIHTQGRRVLVVGLGNHGMDGTRHNVGMTVLGALATRLGVSDGWRGDKQVSGDVIESQLEDVHVVLLRPRLLMNINGVSVAKAASKFGVKPEGVLLLHDELDKPLGRVAVKKGGSARGHNGVRSCVDCLQTDVMLRLRVGIGRPAGKASVERHVLGRFTSEEKKILGSVLDQSVELLLSLVLSLEPRGPPQREAPQNPQSPRTTHQEAQKKPCSPGRQEAL